MFCSKHLVASSTSSVHLLDHGWVLYLSEFKLRRNKNCLQFIAPRKLLRGSPSYDRYVKLKNFSTAGVVISALWCLRFGISEAVLAVSARSVCRVDVDELNVEITKQEDRLRLLRNMKT